MHCPAGLKKSDLAGFYDPVTGSENFLEIIYMFKENYHYVVVGEFEELHLPLEGMLISTSLLTFCSTQIGTINTFFSVFFSRRMNATNDTSVDQQQDTGNLFITYSAIVTMALVPIWVGSFWSLKRKHELESAGQVRYKISRYVASG